MSTSSAVPRNRSLLISLGHLIVHCQGQVRQIVTADICEFDNFHASIIQLTQLYNRGMKPKRNEQPIQVRFPFDILEELRQLARTHERSFNGEIIWGLRQYIAQQRKETEDQDPTESKEIRKFRKLGDCAR
jgi:hypothetical protein